MEDARKAIAEAEAKAAEYAERLRQARADVYKLREQRVKQWSAERDTALDAARKAAGEKVRQAKAELDAEAASARQAIQASAADLAGLAVRAVLPRLPGVPVEILPSCNAASFPRLVWIHPRRRAVAACRSRWYCAHPRCRASSRCRCRLVAATANAPPAANAAAQRLPSPRRSRNRHSCTRPSCNRWPASCTSSSTPRSTFCLELTSPSSSSPSPFRSARSCPRSFASAPRP